MCRRASEGHRGAWQVRVPVFFFSVGLYKEDKKKKLTTIRVSNLIIFCPTPLPLPLLRSLPLFVFVPTSRRGMLGLVPSLKECVGVATFSKTNE